MAINSFGYPGSIDAKTQAVWLPMVASAQYSVQGAGDLRVTARTTADRGISIAAGTAAGDGVMDIVTAADNTLVLPAVSGTASKWFLVVLRRDWGTNRSTFVIVEGNASKQIPTQRKKDAGTLSDQPLALVRVQGAAIAEFVDLRTWGRSGGLFALDELVKGFLTEIGTSVLIGSVRWERVLNSSLAPQWKKSVPGGAVTYRHSDWISNKVIPVNTSPDGNKIVLARVSIPDPGFPYVVTAHATFEGGGTAGTRWDAQIASDKGGILDFTRGDMVAPWYNLTGISNPISGASIVDVIINRYYGSASFGLTTYNRAFNISLSPVL